MPYEPIESKRMYQRAEALADRVWQITAAWDWYAKRTVGVQWVEAADSIGANIAEGGGRYHPADVRKFLYYARGSLRETLFWARRALSRELITAALFAEIEAEVEQLSREVNSNVTYQNSRSSSVREPSPIYDAGSVAEPPPHHPTTSPPNDPTTSPPAPTDEAPPYE